MKTCKTCNSIIANNKVYCNSDCMKIDYRKGKVIIKCIVCGKEKEKPKSQRLYKFCSQVCYNENKIGKKRPEHSLKMKGNTFRRNVKMTIKDRLKVSGENSCNWKGGLTTLYHKVRRLPEYSIWRMAVYKRDDFTCQSCKSTESRLECHHKISMAQIIKTFNIKTIEDAICCKILWDVNNGETLCKDCHKKTDSYGKNTN